MSKILGAISMREGLPNPPNAQNFSQSTTFLKLSKTDWISRLWMLIYDWLTYFPCILSLVEKKNRPRMRFDHFLKNFGQIIFFWHALKITKYLTWKCLFEKFHGSRPKTDLVKSHLWVSWKSNPRRGKYPTFLTPYKADIFTLQIVYSCQRETTNSSQKLINLIQIW